MSLYLLSAKSLVVVYFAKGQWHINELARQNKTEFEQHLGHHVKRVPVFISTSYNCSFKEERQQRLGPGGLDPVEVFDSLPPVSVALNCVMQHVLLYSTQ